MIKDILQTFPPSFVNNAKDIARGYMQKMLETPSRYYEKKLNTVGIGVEWTLSIGEDPQEVEGFYIMVGGEYDRLEENLPF